MPDPIVEVDNHALAEVCRRYGIARLWVYGSTARGKARPDSDIDLLHEIAPGARLAGSSWI